MLDRRSRLSHVVRRQETEGKVVGVSPSNLPQWGLDDALPSPFEQIDELILWTGDHQPGPNEIADWTYTALAAWLGTRLTDDGQNSNLHWLIEQDEVRTYLTRSAAGGDTVGFQLTMDGWLRYHALKDQQSSSRFAFMAMKFGDAELDQVVETTFKLAVARTGFELRTLVQGQGAGLIDDQLRVALRSCRFVLADVTHGNNGAYWEAGFAEGLGKPVIYTCREKEWQERKVHFDTNHLVTIIWDPKKQEDAGRRLAATIRATLPTEAILDD
jgi:hypothetical protein